MSNSNLEEVDRLSELPEPLLLHILSFLTTKFAVRTSLLARRFRRLWSASPSFELDRSDFPPGRLFNDVTTRCLRLRDPSAPLLSFCLKTNTGYRPFSIKPLSNWLNRAHSLGVQDLSLHIHIETIESLFPLILTFPSLHSLFIKGVNLDGRLDIFSFRPLVPPTFPLTQLKYLYIKAKISNSDFQTFIMEQRNLEYLCIAPPPGFTVDLSSQSVKTLKLSFGYTGPKIYLSFPKLEFLDLSIRLDSQLNQFHGEMPVLRKALVENLFLWEDRVPILHDILKTITNVLELTLHLGKPYPNHIPGPTRGWKLNGFDLFHPLVEPGKDMLMFPNLRSLKERPPDCERTRWAPEVWHSKLPLNSEGNRKYADFSNLQAGDKKCEVIKLLSSEKSSKRLKT